MTEQEARLVLNREITEEIVEAIQTLNPNRLPTGFSFDEREVAASIGRQHIINWLRGIVNERERKALPNR